MPNASTTRALAAGALSSGGNAVPTVAVAATVNVSLEPYGEGSVVSSNSNVMVSPSDTRNIEPDDAPEVDVNNVHSNIPVSSSVSDSVICIPPESESDVRSTALVSITSGLKSQSGSTI